MMFSLLTYKSYFLFETNTKKNKQHDQSSCKLELLDFLQINSRFHKQNKKRENRWDVWVEAVKTGSYICIHAKTLPKKITFIQNYI